MKKIYLIELLGQSFYRELALKEKYAALKEIYLNLAENEQQSSKHIEKEIADSSSLFIQKTIASLVALTFKILPYKFLKNSLERILEKRIYSQWFQSYNKFDRKLWRLLIEHEKVQHDLLSPYWNRLK